LQVFAAKIPTSSIYERLKAKARMKSCLKGNILDQFETDLAAKIPTGSIYERLNAKARMKICVKGIFESNLQLIGIGY
jgi:hypothetical protein